MANSPVLVVMAAGMGSRYGGLKQIDPVGSHGEALLDYSLYDAYQAGFRKAVIIIKEAIRQDFMDAVAPRLEKCPMEICYTCQENHMMPEGYSFPEARGQKPWGTTHAVLCAAEAIGSHPFLVLNADDYYGKHAFREGYRWLTENRREAEYCMVAYQVGNTVTENGSVIRGICQFNEEGYLTKIVECSGVERHEGKLRLPISNGDWYELKPETPVSMNMWGFQPDFLEKAKEGFLAFLKHALRDDPAKAEYLLPTTVGRLVRNGQCTVKVLHTPDEWFGVTYAADKPRVVEALRKMTDAGLYPDGLWNT